MTLRPQHSSPRLLDGLHQRHSRTHAPGAFTLLELLIVLVVLAIAVAMVVGSFGGFVAARRLPDSTAQIISMTRYARSQAIARGVPYRLNFDAQSKTFSLTAQDDQGNFADLGVNIGRAFTLPQGIDVTFASQQQGGACVAGEDFTASGAAASLTSGGAGGLGSGALPGMTQSAGPALGSAIGPGANAAGGQFITFLPSGRCDTAILTLKDASSHTSVIGCRSATEEYHVLTAAEQTQ